MDIIETEDFSINTEHHFWEKARLKFVKNLIYRTKLQLASVIDIGCGDCFVLQSLAREFSKTVFVGIDSALTDEITTQITERLKDCPNIVISHDLERKYVANTDLILMLDVLEHIENDEQFLRDLRKMLPDDSKIIVTVPAFQKLFTDHDKRLKHFRRYSREELRNILEQAGFTIIHSGYIFSLLLPFRILQKLFRMKSSLENNLRTPNKFINTIATALLYADAMISFAMSRKKIYLPGLSSFAVASSMPEAEKEKNSSC